MSKDMAKVEQALKDSGHFGDATDVVFDGFTVRAATKDELAAVKAVKAVAVGGEAPDATQPTVQELAAQEAASKAKK